MLLSLNDYGLGPCGTYPSAFAAAYAAVEVYGRQAAAVGERHDGYRRGRTAARAYAARGLVGIHQAQIGLNPGFTYDGAVFLV